MKHVWSVALTAAIVSATLAGGAVSAFAQPVISAKSGLVAYVEGKVLIGDQPVSPSLTSFPDVKENMVLRTEEGRAEILLSPGVFLRVGENSSFRMITNRLIDTRLEVLTGSAVVEADDVAKDTNVTVVSKKAAILIARHGLYRFDMEPARVKVFEGVASVTTGEQTTPVGAGRMLSLDSDTASVEKFNKEDTDALDHWSRRRAENVAMANVSSAKQVHDYGCTNYGTNFSNPVGVPVNSPCSNPCGGWYHNTWYGMITYIPCGANIYSPYGYRYWSPYNVARMYYVAPSLPRGGYGGGGGGGYYPSMGSSAGGYSGSVASSGSSMGSSAGSMASSGSSAASSAGASSAGHGGGGGGSTGGGGHGK